MLLRLYLQSEAYGEIKDAADAVTVHAAAAGFAERDKTMIMLKSSEDYLETILMITAEQGHCRSVDIARKLGFSKPSVSNAVSKLESSSLIERNGDGMILLTEEGREIAEKTLDKHNFLKDFFISIGVSEETAEADACNIEHSLSDETYLKLRHHLRKRAK